MRLSVTDTSNTWYVSGRGRDSPGCGRAKNDTCRSLQPIISSMARDAVIYALPAAQPGEPALEVCRDTAILIDKSFTLIGLGGRKQVIGCSVKNVNGSSSLRMSRGPAADATGNAYDLLREVFVSVRNVHFLNVVLSLSDVHVNMSDCVFSDASMNSFGTLGLISIFISSCQWFGNIACEPFRNCVPSGNLYVGGKITSFDMYKTEMFHTLLKLTTISGGEITLSEVTFSNSPHLIPVHGGAKIALKGVDNCTVRIIDCQFTNIYHWNPIYSVMNIFEASLLLRFQDNKGRFYSPVHNKIFVHVHNTLFENNERALTLQGNLETVKLENTIFRSNVAIHAGAAILVLTNRTVHIVNSTFQDNAAGSFRATEVRHPGDHFAVDGDEVQINSECCKGSISLIGKGGAVRVQKGHMTLEASSLVNNTARLLGGAVFVDRESTLTLKGSYFTNSDVFQHSSQGDLLYSNGKVRIDGAHLQVKSANNHISVLQHSGEHWSMFLLDITIHCPTGHRLRVVNTSAYRVAPNEGLKRSYMLDQLSYFCESCPRHKYSRDRGYLRYKLNQGVYEYFTLMINGQNPKSDFDGVYEYHDIVCKECPYGAVCDTTIKALPNFWGYSYLENVRFSLCPKGYCCSSPNQCQTYNICQLNRRGPLCSQCRENYTEALFSSQCVPDHLCGPYWLWPFALGLGLLYMLFLLFQKDIRDFIFSFPWSESEKEKGEFTSDSPTRAFGCCRLCRKRSSVYETQVEQKERIMLNGMSLDEPEEAMEMEVTSGTVSAEAHSNRKTSTSNIADEENNKSGEADKDTATPAPATDNGAALLVIILYYFQDALLFHVKTVSSSTEHKSRAQLKALLLGFFKFRLEVAQFVDNVCAVTGMPPHIKLMMKTLLVPYVLLLFGLLYVAYKCKVCARRTRNADEQKKEDAFYVRLSTGFMLCLLFTYQRLTISAFTLLNCVPVGEDHVLFIDGQVTCYEPWQYGVLAYALICIVPFCCVLFLGPGLMRDGLIGLPQFFFACLLPLPFTVAWTLGRLGVCCWRRKSGRPTDVQLQPETEAVYKVLQAPFNDIEGKYIGPQCWSGVLIGRRLILVLLFTFVNNTLIRILSMLFVSFLVLLHHVHVKPYKDWRANIAGSMSVSAMMLIGGINLVRAGFEAAEYTPQGPNRTLVKVMEETENVLMLWIPLFIMIVVCIALIWKFSFIIYSKACKKQKTK